MGAGVAVLDFDSDGWLDILFINSGAITQDAQKLRIDRSAATLGNRLFRNDRNGHFTDVTPHSGLAQQDVEIYGMGATTADYDNDGDTDVLITGYGGVQLFENRDNGQFRNVTTESTIEVPGWSTSAGFADLDNDGLLDLVVTRYLDWNFEKHISCGGDIPSYCPPIEHQAITSKLFLNKGGNRFQDASVSSGLAKMPGKALGIAFNDVEPDGDIDIVLANDSTPQQLLINQGKATFMDSAMSAGVAYNEDGGSFAGMGVDFEDYDNDGRPDILITNLARELYALYHNDSGGLFSYTTRQSSLASITSRMSGWGVRFVDMDLDGWKDIFVTQGHVLDTIRQTDPGLSYRQPPLLALGSKGRFKDASTESGEIFKNPLSGRGAAFGDLDNDGDVDIVMGVLDDSPRLLCNNASESGQHWIGLRLTGVQSPRDGQGAMVSLHTPDGLKQFRHATTTGSYISANDPRVHFGLGENTTVEWIQIQWPSGIKQQLNNIKADQYLIVREETR